MRRHVNDSPSKLLGVGRPAPHRVLAAGVVTGLIAPAAWLLAGCSSSGGDLISTVALPSMQSVEAAGPSGELDMSASAGADRMGAPANVTPVQRGYLDALLAAGVRPSNDLRALSIGAYVCQARAAGQSDEAVWDAVAPMVRNDMAEAKGGANAPEVAYVDVNPVIGNYIGIATQRLC